ncbi:Solute carrier family 12 member 9 [Habropoda laboriosa]|uniref:Solute carrier family 12 member 9 n=1 Tax=Habropoda laboriosa TaxID=597456 RepID=A0A0L7QRB5_9HYME|nr:Solute carrier family 12 member 9 [Habropoda laboriosa]
MIASEVGSTNNESVHIKLSNEKAPLIYGRGVLHRLSNFLKFGKTQHAEGDGYVEFGSLGTDSGRTLGTFAGVFSPVALSMFSALVFIRMGYIVGNAGLLVTLTQFIIAYGILLFTVASVCAISTNGAVEGGGAYFMISRTLGPEFGGSIGTLFFMANIVSSALCIAGFAEGLIENFGPSGYLAGKSALIPDGAAMFAKTSVAILAVVSVCLISIFISFLAQGSMEIPIPNANELIQNATYHVNGTYTGLLSSTLISNLYSNYSPDYSTASTSRFLLQNNFMYMMPINIWPPFVAVGILTATFSAGLSNLIGSSRVLEALAKDNVFGSGLNFITQGTWKGNPIAAVLTSWTLVQIILLIGSLNTIAQINSVLFLLSYLATNLACLGLELASAPNFRPTFNYFTWHTATIGLLGTLIMMFVINSIYASSSIILCLILIIVLHLFSPSKNAPWGSISQALIFHQVRKYLLMLDSRKDHVKFWRPQILLMVASPRSACPLIDFINDLKKGGLYVIGHVKIGEFLGQNIDPAIEEYPHWLSLVDHMKVKAFVELTVTKTVREGLHHLIRISGMGAMKPNTIVLGFYDEKAPIDFFKNSQYATDMFENVSTLSNSTAFPLRQIDGEKYLDPVQYVGMCSDVLKMKKNLCLCRNFDTLNKLQITKNSSLKYIDVWPVNFFQPTDQDPFDTTSLFMLQLACIINMVPAWKNLHLRVFHCESSDSTASLSTSDSQNSISEFPRVSNEHRIRKLLNMLRISASIKKIPDWEVQVRGLKGRSLIELRVESQYESSAEGSDVLSNVSRAYILSVNQLIRQHSSQTAATFIYLPAPPVSNTWDENAMYRQYLQLLTELTADLPPIILVHGVSAVTSTTL